MGKCDIQLRWFGLGRRQRTIYCGACQRDTLHARSRRGWFCVRQIGRTGSICGRHNYGRTDNNAGTDTDKT